MYDSAMWKTVNRSNKFMKFSVRPVKEDDLECIMNWRMSPDVTKYMNTNPKLTLEEQRKWFSSIQENQTVRYWVIEVNSTPAGVINLAEIDYENKRTSWGYYIGEKQLRSMKLAMSLELSLYAYVFEELDFEEIYGPVFSLNWEVIRIHEMCGAHIVKECKKELNKDGISYDITHMSITKQDWNANRSYYKKFERISF